MRKRLALGGIGVGVLAAGGVVGSRLVAQWKANPDPLEGKPVRLPEGEVRCVALPDGAVINTVTVGTGPVIVAVHGLTASRHDWGPMTPALVEAGYQVIAVDQRGHGGSTAGTAGYGSSQLAADLAVVLDELDLRGVALMGHSMGGMTAMTLAVEHRELFSQRVGALVLIATAASLDTVRHRLTLPLGGISIPDALMPAEARMRLGAGLGVFGKRPSLHMVDEAIRSFTQCPETVRTAATVALADHDVEDQLATIDVATLVIGAGRDQLIRPSQVRDLASGIKDARLELFPDAGHMVLWERHHQISAMVIEFLVESKDAQPVSTLRP